MAARNAAADARAETSAAMDGPSTKRMRVADAVASTERELDALLSGAAQPGTAAAAAAAANAPALSAPCATEASAAAPAPLSDYLARSFKDGNCTVGALDGPRALGGGSAVALTTAAAAAAAAPTADAARGAASNSGAGQASALQNPAPSLRLVLDSLGAGAQNGADAAAEEDPEEEWPPDGHLNVPVLRHQRMALAWMLKIEHQSPPPRKGTANGKPGAASDARRPCGGILADDQGLGKTVTTLSLIVSNRARQGRNEEVCRERQRRNVQHVHPGASAAPAKTPPPLATGTKADPVCIEGPAPPPRSISPKAALSTPEGTRVLGGTLVVCPTSVLRQWEREVRDKVSRAAHLSVIVHHGPGRTKGDITLASYDLVITTYAIVSLETPMPNGVLPGANGSERKEESGPLSRIHWHRIVLDESQAIKNGRTRVAKACWALKGKRRWCLSGTPVQNTVQDLHSIFKFLRYKPFDDPVSFRKTVMDAMREDSVTGCQRLRAILEPIALRRTKSTLLNGEPVVRLPKRVELPERLTLSEHERRCYEMLAKECNSAIDSLHATGGAQAINTLGGGGGAEPTKYAHALRMLLRLRQACDDIGLVRGGQPEFLRAREAAIKAGAAAPPNGSTSPASSAHHRADAEVPGAGAVSAASLVNDAAERARLLALVEHAATECAICHDAVEDPVINVSCCHIFCRECIAAQLAETGSEDCSLCPATIANTGEQCRMAIRPEQLLDATQLRDATDAGASANAVPDPDDDIPRPVRAVLGSLCSTKVRAVLAYLDALSKRCSWPRVRASDGVPLSVLLANGSLGAPTTPPPTLASAGRKPNPKLLAPGCSSAATASALPKLPPLPPAPGPPPGTETLEKVVVFSQWTSMLDILEAKMKMECYPYRRLDGSMAVVKREEALADFRQSTHESPRVLLASLKAASVGLNLACANHVLLVDPWWNPTTEEQAIDRCHRLGQRREVHVVRFLVSDTVEDRICELQSRKREMVGAVMEGHNAVSANLGGRQRLSMTELRWLFNG